MKQFFLHIISLATLSVLIVFMSVGVAILPECCRIAGEKLSANAETHTCHCHHDDTSVNQETQETQETFAMHGHCKVAIEKKDLMQHIPQEIINVPVCVALPYTFLELPPYSIIVQNNMDWGHSQTHSPPGKVGRMKFFSTFII